jgi:HAE1 family hydrophobic/amphiphilic exporter-1
MARSAVGFAGFVITEDYEQRYGHNLGTVMVALPAKGRRAFDDPAAHLERMRARLAARFGDDDFTVRVRAEKDGPPTGKDVNVRVVGTDEGAVAALAGAIRGVMAASPDIGPHLVQLDDDRGQPARVYRLEVDQDRAREYGLTQGQAARLAAAVLDGRYLGEYRLATEEVDLKLRIDPGALTGPASALDIPLLEHASGPVRLGDVVHPVATLQPGELHRYQGQRSVSITANIAPGAPISSAFVARWVEERYEAMRAEHPGATITFGGAFDETQRSYASLTQAFGIAVLLIYLILATQFRSYVQPLIILSAVMFALIGVVLGKLVTQGLFTVNSFIAMVGVTGVVVNDALVLLDFINRNYRRGMSRHEAIREAVRVRLRPILLTTLTTTLGLLPMAVGFPSYSLVWGGMASTFVTGLATATLLTLLVVPVEWDVIMAMKERRERRRVEKSTAQPAPRDEPRAQGAGRLRRGEGPGGPDAPAGAPASRHEP